MKTLSSMAFLAMLTLSFEAVACEKIDAALAKCDAMDSIAQQECYVKIQDEQEAALEKQIFAAQVEARKSCTERNRHLMARGGPEFGLAYTACVAKEFNHQREALEKIVKAYSLIK